MPAETIVVMITATDILVHGRKVADIGEVLADENGRVIESVKDELMFQAGQMWDQDALESIDGAAITIMADKKVPYKLLRRIMLTMADTPYKKISLAVRKKGKEDKE
jgi:biopolymer transport protein ExbD